MSDTNNTQGKRKTLERSPLYTEKRYAAMKKRDTKRDLDGAYRYLGRLEDLARAEQKEAA